MAEENKLPDRVKICPTCRSRFGGFANGRRIPYDAGDEVLPTQDLHEAKTLCLTCATQEAFEAATGEPR